MARAVARKAARSRRARASWTKKSAIAKDTSGKQAAIPKARWSSRIAARWPPTTPISTAEPVMHAHCTAWKAPVSPRGRPDSTMRASVSTSVKASPKPMIVKRAAIHQKVCTGVSARQIPESAASVQVRRK